MWFTAFLTGLAAPLFWIGIGLVGLCGISIAVTMAQRDDVSINSDEYAMYYERTKRLIIGLLASLTLVGTGWAIPPVNYQTKIVSVEKIVQIQSAYGDIFNQCINNSADRSLEYRQKCSTFTVQEIKNQKDAGELVKKADAKVVYLRSTLPRLFSDCMDQWKVTNARAEAMTRINTNCDVISRNQYAAMAENGKFKPIN